VLPTTTRIVIVMRRLEAVTSDEGGGVPLPLPNKNLLPLQRDLLPILQPVLQLPDLRFLQQAVLCKSDVKTNSVGWVIPLARGR
jgi:hypothetical protein